MNADIDFIVHPLFFVFFPNDGEKRRYWDTLKEVAKKSKRVILLNNPVPNLSNSSYRFLKRASEQTLELAIEGNFEILETNSIELPFETYSYGHVSDKDFDKLKQILVDYDIHSKIRIHGTYHNQCPQNTAVQIYHFFKTGENFYDYFKYFSSNSSGISVNRIRYYILREKLKYNLLELSSGLLKSNIRYGVTFSGKSMGKEEYRTFLGRNFTLINSLESQLMDEQSVLCGI